MRSSWICFAITLCIVGLASALVTRDDRVTVWIDNGDEITVSVSVNGEPPIRVLPGQRRKISCRPGHSFFAVSRECGTVQIESHYLRPPARDEPSRTYLLNPDRNRYYVTANIAYGDAGQRQIIDLALSNGLLTGAFDREEANQDVRLERHCQLY